ncbi:hypothetical protein D3C81_1063580 [compost metagenome]
MQEDLTGVADQEGIAVAVELQRIDDRGDGLQAHVAGGDAQQFAIAQHRYGHGEDLLLGAGVDERLGHHQAPGGHRVLVPATGARIVAVRHGAVGAHGEGAGGSLAKVDRGEVLLQDLLFQHLLDRTGGGIAGGQLRRLAFHQMDAAFQPDLDIAGGQGAEFGEIGLGIVVDRLALPVVVEQDETGEGEDHDEGGCQEDLPGEGQRAKHGQSTCGWSGNSSYRQGRALLEHLDNEKRLHEAGVLHIAALCQMKRVASQNRPAARPIDVGRVRTQASRMLRTVPPCRPLRLATMLPATPEDST